jgi:hypothetical protein
MMVHQKWKLLSLGILMSVIAATLFMMGAHASVSTRTPGIVGYWTVNAWLDAVFAAAAQFVMPTFGLILWGGTGTKRR